MANDKDKMAPPTLGPDQIIRGDTPHVVSFNERTGKATSSAGGARSLEREPQARATESVKDKTSEQGSTRVIADEEAPLADQREKGAASADVEANIEKAKQSSGSDSVVGSLPRNAIVDTQVEGWAQDPTTDRRVKAPEDPPAGGNESALPAETARLLDKMAADVNRTLRDVRLEMEPIEPRKDAEPTRPREAIQGTKVDEPHDGPQADGIVTAVVQSAIQSTRVTKPAEPSGAAQSAVKSPSRAISDNVQAVEATPADAAAPASMISRAELRDNVQRAPDDRSRNEEPGAQPKGIERKPPEAAGAPAIDSEEFAAALDAATATAIAKLDANALLKLSLGAEIVARLNQEQAQTQEISQKLDAIHERLRRPKSDR